MRVFKLNWVHYIDSSLYLLSSKGISSNELQSLLDKIKDDVDADYAGNEELPKRKKAILDKLREENIEVIDIPSVVVWGDLF